MKENSSQTEKVNKARKSLVTGVLSLMLSVALLIGTTFAWFTDSVKSGVNKIVSGNLDVEMEYAALNTDGSIQEWKSVTETTSLFSEDTLWEPGYSQVVYLKISNKGSLAFNYKLDVTVLEETWGWRRFDNGMEEYAYLSDYLKFGVISDWDGTPYATREDARAAISESGKIGDYTVTGGIDATADAQYVALIVYMPEEVGNELNCNKTAPTITMGINLTAYQKVSEYDSFGNDYDASQEAFLQGEEQDAKAWYDAEATELTLSTAAQLFNFSSKVNAGETFKGKTITLNNDIDLANISWTPIGNDTTAFMGTFDGNGHTISGLNIDTATEEAGLFGKVLAGTVKNVVVEGNINIDITDYVKGSLTAAGICAYAAQTQITGCTSRVNIHITGDDASSSQTVVGGILGCASSVLSEGFVDNVYYDGGGVTITDCLNEGDISGLIMFAGGIVGVEYNGVTITNVVNVGKITTDIDWTDFFTEEELKEYDAETKAALKEEMEGFYGVAGILGTSIGSTNMDITSWYTLYSPKYSNTEKTVTGENTATSAEAMADKSTFTTFDFDSVWELTNGKYPTLQ